jgi:tRNA threonylcarbamoyladenosine biosynthesis protein TsaB
MLLAFDTSTSVASVALVNGARLVAELTWQVGQRHSTELLERLEWLLAASRVTMDDLSGVAVALGPGSFNGVRVALATAKSLAFARALPLYGVPTLDVIAWGHSAVGGTICAILEAGRGQVYAATYAAAQADAAGWSPVDSYAVVTVSELAAQLPGDVYFCGEMSSETRATLAEALGSRFRSASALETRRAGWLAELALARAVQQRYDDLMTLEPLYLRRPAITTSARRGLPASEGAANARQREDAPGGEGTSNALRR